MFSRSLLRSSLLRLGNYRTSLNSIRFYSSTNEESISTPLLQDPLALSHLKRIRDASSEFELPLLVSIDAFDTLYKPTAPIFQQYFDVSSTLGFAKSAADIERDFPIVYAEIKEKWPNYGKSVGFDSDTWWKELIVKVYNIEHYSKSEKSNELCERLIAHFTGGGAYRVFDDVIPVLEKLRDRGVVLVASSNSDSRVHGILDSLKILKYFDNVVLSYDVDYSKPSRQFFDSILKQSFPDLPKGQLLERCWHVGDKYKEDFVGLIKSGWNGVLLDRDGTSEFFRRKNIDQLPESECFMSQQQFELKDKVKNNNELVILADNRVAMSSLHQLETLFKLD